VSYAITDPFGGTSYVGFEVIIAVTLKSRIFSIVTSCISEGAQRFGETACISEEVQCFGEIALIFSGLL
jgi:hypothetical protein